MIFIDTSGLYAVLDRDDLHHAAARAAWADILRTSDTMLTHNYALVEMYALCQGRLGLAALRAVEDTIVPLLRVQWIAESQHRAAVQMALAADRRKLSVVDCASFLIMREQRIAKAFTFDRHFGEQGFEPVPPAQ